MVYYIFFLRVGKVLSKKFLQVL